MLIEVIDRSSTCAVDRFCRLELPIPNIDSINELDDRLLRILRSEQSKNALCFRYGELCSLETIQVDIIPEKKGRMLDSSPFAASGAESQHTPLAAGLFIRHFEYEVMSMVNIFFFALVLVLLLFAVDAHFIVLFSRSVTGTRSTVGLTTLSPCMNC